MNFLALEPEADEAQGIRGGENSQGKGDLGSLFCQNPVRAVFCQAAG